MENKSILEDYNNTIIEDNEKVDEAQKGQNSLFVTEVIEGKPFSWKFLMGGQIMINTRIGNFFVKVVNFQQKGEGEE